MLRRAMRIVLTVALSACAGCAGARVCPSYERSVAERRADRLTLRRRLGLRLEPKSASPERVVVAAIE